MTKKERIRKKRIQIKNRKILKRYPFMMPVDWYGNRISPEQHEYLFTSCDDIPRGWFKCFGIMMLEEIRTAAIKNRCMDTLYFVQIKEKYGRLEMYDCGGCKDIDNIIAKYSYISECVCIKCGKPDSPILNLSWISPYCKDCYTKIQKRAEKFGSICPEWESLFMPGDDIIPNSYMYTRFYPDKENETIEVDISETVKKIRMKGSRHAC